MAAVIVALLFLNVFMAPFSPLNNSLGDGFNYYQNTDYNPARYSELENMIKLIPATEQYVAYQNNIPEIMPRELPNVTLMGGNLGSFTSFNKGEAINNLWNVSSGGSTFSEPINYALADAANPNFYLENNSMYSLVQDMYSSGRYSIVSEGYGLILLSRNYSGNMLDYSPENITLVGHKISSDNVSSPAVSNSISGPTTYESPKGTNTLSYLFPGKYSMNLIMTSSASSNALSNETASLKLYSGDLLLNVTMFNFDATTTSNQIQVLANLNQIYGDVWFSLSIGKSAPSKFLVSLYISQNLAYQNINT